MNKLNKILAVFVIVLSSIGIMICAGVMYSYATNRNENMVYNNAIENHIVQNEVAINNAVNVIENNEEKNQVKTIENGAKAEKKTGQSANNTSNKKNVNVGGKEYTAENVAELNQKVQELQKEFPKGYYWNHAGNAKNGSVTKTPCNHKEGKCYCNVYDSKSTRACGFKVGRQCAGFASMLSDRVFGKDAPVRIFYNYDDIRVGDQARINNNSHTVFIIEKTDDYVVVAECNADYKTCVINWGRKIPRSGLKGFYLTRWE